MFTFSLNKVSLTYKANRLSIFCKKQLIKVNLVGDFSTIKICLKVTWLKVRT